jgi:hypothetical protein
MPVETSFGQPGFGKDVAVGGVVVAFHRKQLKRLLDNLLPRPVSLFRQKTSPVKIKS